MTLHEQLARLSTLLREKADATALHLYAAGLLDAADELDTLLAQATPTPETLKTPTDAPADSTPNAVLSNRTEEA